MRRTPKLTPEDINLLVRILDSGLNNPAAADQFKQDELRQLKEKLVLMLSPTLGRHDPEDFEPT
jgi:hypothetical protein